MAAITVQFCYELNTDGGTEASIVIDGDGERQRLWLACIDSKLIQDPHSRRLFKDTIAALTESYMRDCGAKVRSFRKEGLN